MTTAPQQFPASMRVLHWLMAASLLAMLAIGVAMIDSLYNYHTLIAIHRPLGILILLLVVIRLINRLFSNLPPFPPGFPPTERLAVVASEFLLYTLMFLLPLVGWAMLSAARYPIVMFGSFHLFPILPQNVALYAFLRKTHTILAYLLFFAFLAHFSAVLFHNLVLRDRIFDRMAPWKVHAR